IAWTARGFSHTGMPLSHDPCPAGASRKERARRGLWNRAMTPIYRQKINAPMAWVGSDFKSKEDIVFELGPRAVRALEDILLRVRDLPRDEITRDLVAHPDLDGEL